MPTKLIRFFTWSSALLLFITGIAKIVSATGSARLLQYSDSILHMPFREIFWAVGAVEVGVALIMFFSNSFLLKYLILSWLSTNFLIYHIGLAWSGGWQKTCPCLGNLTEALHISPHIADSALKIIVTYLLVGSYSTLFWIWRQKRKAACSGPSLETSVRSAA